MCYRHSRKGVAGLFNAVTCMTLEQVMVQDQHQDWLVLLLVDPWQHWRCHLDMLEQQWKCCLDMDGQQWNCCLDTVEKET